VLLPGEVVSEEALDYLMAVLQAGGSVMGCSDATLKTLRVLKETPE
jgi:arginine/lysine/ornithine decarboxylase